MKKLNIGVDIDDTITNSFDYLMPYIAEFFKVDIDYLKENNISYSNLPDEWQKREIEFAHEYYDEVIPYTTVKPDALEYLQKIKEMEHRIVIITARDNTRYTDAYKTTTELLENNNIPYDELVCSKDKAKVCKEKNIDLFIDDSINNCKQVSKEKIQTLLFDNKINKEEKELIRVNNWKEVYDYIINL